MKTHWKLLLVGALGTTLALPLRTSGQSFDLSWNTLDGGGAMNSAGGAFTLAGTIGQSDAQTPPVMSGGSFQLVGGFWPGTDVVCTCPGDMNGDSLRNGLDIRQFVQCVVSGGSCGCADVDGVPGVNLGDVAVFVNSVLTGSSCP